MKYLTITYPDINNGVGFRATLWITGCTHHCPGCHNKHTWEYEQGIHLLTDDTKNNIINIFKHDYISGLTISGGDPLDQSDKSLKELLVFLKWFKEKYPNKNIWLYTGFTYAELLSKNSNIINDILKLCDVLIDGPYIKNLKNAALAFRGSSNQNIINLHNNI